MTEGVLEQEGQRQPVLDEPTVLGLWSRRQQIQVRQQIQDHHKEQLSKDQGRVFQAQQAQQAHHYAWHV